MMALLFVAGAVIGAVGMRAWHAAYFTILMDGHKKEMDEIFEEVKRLRTQVAALIGKE